MWLFQAIERHCKEDGREKSLEAWARLDVPLKHRQVNCTQHHMSNRLACSAKRAVGKQFQFRKQHVDGFIRSSRFMYSLSASFFFLLDDCCDSPESSFVSSDRVRRSMELKRRSYRPQTMNAAGGKSFLFAEWFPSARLASVDFHRYRLIDWFPLSRCAWNSTSSMSSSRWGQRCAASSK